MNLDEKKRELARLVPERERVAADFAEVRKAHQDTLKDIEGKISRLAHDVQAGQADLFDGEAVEAATLEVEMKPWATQQRGIMVQA